MQPNIFSDTPWHGVLAWITLGYLCVVATGPWMRGRARGLRGIFLSTGIALLILGVLCAALVLQCEIGYCGHGAMILFPLLVLAGIVAALTLVSAALALYWWRK